jgi:tetratricopeptide (TPR) repeat protein
MKRAYLLCCLSVSFHTLFACAEPLLWGKLTAGPYRVGYTTSWTQDDSRSFEAMLPDGSQFGGSKTPRPILMMEWYPAAVKSGQRPMVQSDYLTLAPTTGKLYEVAEALIQFSRDEIAEWVVDAGDSKALDASQQAALKRYYSAATVAYRDAPAKSGQYPLVVYMHGAGSSFEDNSVLCEYLASRGFVVITSAYQSSDLEMISSRQENGDDLQFLIHYGRGLANVDGSKVALVGHSAGAQSSLAYQSREGAMADAVVTLDTTEDYFYTDERLIFRKLVDSVSVSHLKVPILFVARPEAMFDLADSLTESHRYYLTERDTKHGEFVSAGLAHAILFNDPKREDVDAKFSALSENIVGFLRTSLHVVGASAWPGEMKLDFRKQVVNLVDVPAGVSEPPAYTAGDVSPTPRQLREMVEKGKYEEALAALNKFAVEKDWNPIYKTSNGNLDHLFEIKQDAIAHRFYEAYVKANPGAEPEVFWTRIAEQCLKKGQREDAVRYYQRVVTLKPDDAQALERLKKAEALSEPNR